MHFSFVDIVFFVIILFFGIMACAKGFIKELFGKLSVIAGILVAVLFCGKLSPYLENIIKIQTACVVIAFILLFIATFLLVKIIQTVIGSIASGDILKSLDRLLGFVLGVLEGLAIVCFILVLLKAQPWFNADSLTSDSFFWAKLSGLLDKPIKNLNAVFV